jgi:hypothetical protein
MLSGDSTAIVFSSINGGVGKVSEEVRISTNVISVMVGVEDGDEFCLQVL